MSALTSKVMLAGLATSMLVAGFGGPASATRRSGRAAPRFVSATGEQSTIAPFALVTSAPGFKGEAHPRRHVVEVHVPRADSADERMAQGGSASPHVVIGADNRVRVT